MRMFLGMSPGKGLETSVASGGFNSAVTTYETAVQAVGGTLSTPAKDLLQSAITTSYNGLTYADYSAKLRYFWCPLSDFTGVRIPIKGSSFTNVGFVSGDWNINTGLQCGTGKYLNTGVALNTETVNNTCLSIGVRPASGSWFNWPTGAGSTGSGDGYILGNFTSSLIVDSYNGTAGRLTLSDAQATNGAFILNRQSSTNFTVHRDTTQLGSLVSTAGLLTSENIFVGNMNYTGYSSDSCSSPVDSASYGAALTDAERISFAGMLSAIRTGRALL